MENRKYTKDADKSGQALPQRLRRDRDDEVIDDVKREKTTSAAERGAKLDRRIAFIEVTSEDYALLQTYHQHLLASKEELIAKGRPVGSALDEEIVFCGSALDRIDAAVKVGDTQITIEAPPRIQKVLKHARTFTPEASAPTESKSLVRRILGNLSLRRTEVDIPEAPPKLSSS